MQRIGFLLIALAACGGTDSTALDGGLDGSSSESSASDATTKDVATNDATTSDAGADAIAPTDGAVADADGSTVTGTPGKVTCGNVVCNTGQECCAAPSGDGGFTLTCVNGGGACPNGVTRACDEAADCPLNEVCCYEEQGGNLAAGCHGDCGGGGGTRFQACASTAECQSGTCSVHTCTAGGSVETCEGIPNVCP
ncbi:MAG TPA: hypothetical protein VGH28_05715 [Polyangiaceae bacterium]|jgi:hypothetical protein